MPHHLPGSTGACTSVSPALGQRKLETASGDVVSGRAEHGYAAGRSAAVPGRHLRGPFGNVRNLTKSIDQAGEGGFADEPASSNQLPHLATHWLR